MSFTFEANSDGFKVLKGRLVVTIWTVLRGYYNLVPVSEEMHDASVEFFLGQTQEEIDRFTTEAIKAVIAERS